MHIFAISGGSLAEGETLALDRFNLELTGKGRLRVLFIPTASSDSPGYCRTFREIYGSLLGCEVDTLLLGSADRETAVIEDKIGAADLVYVGGGSTLRLMTVWRRHGVDGLLRGADLGWACDDLTAVWHPHGGPPEVRSLRPEAAVRIMRRTGGALQTAVYRHGDRIEAAFASGPPKRVAVG